MKALNNWLLIPYILTIFSGLSFLIMYLLIFCNIFPLLITSELTVGRDLTYYLDSTMAFLKGQNPYDFNYKYLPITIFFFIPFAIVNYKIAYVSMLIINLALLITTTYFLIKILDQYNVKLDKIKKTLLFVSLILFYPLTSTIVSGQIGNMVILCFIVIFYYLYLNKSYWSSLMLVIPIILKLFPIALLIYHLSDRNYKQLTISLIALLLIVLTSIFLLGLPLHYSYIRTYIEYQNFDTWNNASLSPIYISILAILNVNVSFFTNMCWMISKIMAIVLLLFYFRNIFTLPKLHQNLLVFSAINVIIIALPNFSQSYYCVFLIPSYILFMLAFKLDIVQKVLLFISLILYAYQMHILYLNKIIGVILNDVSLGLYPTYGTLFFIIFLIYTMYKLNSYTTEIESLSILKA